jgi:hypothetical protein
LNRLILPSGILLRSVNPKAKPETSVRLTFRDPEKIPKKLETARRSRPVRDVDAYTGSVCTKDARVSVGGKAYHLF